MRVVYDYRGRPCHNIHTHKFEKFLRLKAKLERARTRQVFRGREREDTSSVSDGVCTRWPSLLGGVVDLPSEPIDWVSFKYLFRLCLVGYLERETADSFCKLQYTFLEPRTLVTIHHKSDSYHLLRQDSKNDCIFFLLNNKNNCLVTTTNQWNDIVKPFARSDYITSNIN